MIKEIDFLKAKRKDFYKAQKLIRLLNVGSLVGLIFYCLVVAATIYLLFQLKSENQELQNQIKIKKDEVGRFKEVESLQYVLKQRLTPLTKIITPNRKSPSSWLSFFQGSLDTGVVFKKLDMTDKGEISFGGQAPDAIALGRFLDYFNTDEAKNIFTKTLVNSLSKQKDGSYLFNLSFVVNEKY